MAISSIVTTGQQGALATINGSGFGATQGSSVLVFYPGYNRGMSSITPVSWSATVITANIPSNATVGAGAFFALQLADGSAGDRTDSFTVLPTLPSAETSLSSSILVTAKPGASGETLEM